MFFLFALYEWQTNTMVRMANDKAEWFLVSVAIGTIFGGITYLVVNLFLS